MESRIAFAWMPLLFAARLLCVTAAGVDSKPATAPETVWESGTHHLTFDGRERTFILDVPSGPKPGAPLVMIFHGFTGSAKDIRELTGFAKVSEHHGFVAVYPEGTIDAKGRTFFNVGYQFHRDQTVDDVRFARGLAERLTRDLGLDPRAVFATGFSNGGDLSFFLGAQREPFVAAIAPVAGTMMESWAKGFRPARRIPVLAVNVKDDRTTLWDGDLRNRDGWGAYLGTEAVLDLWVKGLALERSEHSDVTRTIQLRRWSTASDATEARLYVLGAGDHHWPSNLGDERETTAEAIWRFFAAHRSRAATNIVISLDRTTQDWSDLAMGGPAADDDADTSRNPRKLVSYVPGYGKPHADAGAIGTGLPRLNDGKFALTSDDPGNSIWFETKGNSRVLLNLGTAVDVARINVFSWHSGALSPQRYTLWAADGDSAPAADPADLALGWKKLAEVDTTSLGEGGKHGSSLNARDGVIGRYRYLLFDLPANKPEWSRSGFLSEIDVYAAGRKLDAITVIPRTAATQTLAFGNIRRSKPLKDETEFLIAGPKLYEFGSMDGSFPQVGRLDGDQGGIWCHPIKLVNTFGFEVLEADRKPWRLLGPSRFEHDFASASLHFERNELKAIRRDFVPEDESALVSLLTLRNDTDRPREVTVRFSATVNLRPSYESRLPNGSDVIEYQEGLLGGSDSAMAEKWGVVFGSDQSPTDHGIAGANGFLNYRVTLPSRGEATLKFLVVGEHQDGVKAARARFPSIASRTAELLAAKQALYRERILGGVKFSCSDPEMNDAFLCAKANVLMSVMDLRPNYPAPFLAAGFPIYTWLFGCDSLHSTPGVAAAGFDEAARSTLECLLHFAAEHKQGAHEVASNGRLLGWDHIQETPQLVQACRQHFQWTGDLGFLKAAYPVCREIIAHVLATADQDHDGYLEGPGLMEQAGMGPERIDSVCQLYAAYESLAAMAEALGESGAGDFRRRAAQLKRNFNRDWWNPVEKMWACSLRTDGSQTMDNFWAVAFPQQVGIAEPDKAAIVLDRIQKEWVNDQWGFVHQWKSKITGEGAGVVHNNVLAQTAFTYGRTDLGWRLMQLSAQAPLGERMLGAFDETIPGGGDLVQLWSFGPFLECVIEGLAGVRPQPGSNRVDLLPQLPRSLDWFKIEDCRIGQHRLAVEQRRIGKRIITTVTHTAGDAPLTGRFWLPADAFDATIELNGQAIKPQSQTMPQSGIEVPCVNYELRVGQRLTFERTSP